MMVSQPRLSFGALALVVSLAVPVGFLSLVARSTTGEQVDAADLIVVARVASLQFVADPPRTIVELAIDRAVVGAPPAASVNVVVDGRSALAAGDMIVGLLGQQPTELLGAYQLRKNPSTLEDEVVSDVTGMLAQGVRGGGLNDPVPLDVFEMGILSRRGLGLGGFAVGGGPGPSGAPKGVTVPADAAEPNDTLATRTTITGLHLPTLVTGHPLIVSGLTLTLGDVDFFSLDAEAWTLLYAETLPPGVTGLPVPDTYMGLFDATPPGQLLEADDDSGRGTLSQITHLFEEEMPVAVAVESAPDPTNKFDGSTGTTEGFYSLSLEFKLGSFLVNGIDQIIGASPDGTFIEDFVGYKFIGGDDVLLHGVPADGWGLAFDAHAPGGVTHVFGGAGDQLTDRGFISAVEPISFELGPFTTSAGTNRRGFAESAEMVIEMASPQRGVEVTHTYRLPIFDKTIQGDVSLQIATDDKIDDLLYTRVMDVDLFDNGTDTFNWSFDPNSKIKAFAVDLNTNVGNIVVPAQSVAREVGVDRQFALLIDDGDTPANKFGEVHRYKVGFTHIEGFSTQQLALEEAVRRLRLEAGATTWVVAVDQDPVSLKFAAFGAGLGQ